MKSFQVTKNYCPSLVFQTEAPTERTTFVLIRKYGVKKNPVLSIRINKELKETKTDADIEWACVSALSNEQMDDLKYIIPMKNKM